MANIVNIIKDIWSDWSNVHTFSMKLISNQIILMQYCLNRLERQINLEESEESNLSGAWQDSVIWNFDLLLAAF